MVMKNQFYDIDKNLFCISKYIYVYMYLKLITILTDFTLLSLILVHLYNTTWCKYNFIYIFNFYCIYLLAFINPIFHTLYHVRMAGLNSIRVWGGGVAERTDFYNICDELGLLVYQEFFMTGDNNGRWAGSYDWPENKLGNCLGNCLLCIIIIIICIIILQLNN